eukprot:1195686-Prorocentrum_minimum.AAC.7
MQEAAGSDPAEVGEPALEGAREAALRAERGSKSGVQHAAYNSTGRRTIGTGGPDVAAGPYGDSDKAAAPNKTPD